MEPENLHGKKQQTKKEEFQKENSQLLNRVFTKWEHGNFPVNVWKSENTKRVIYEAEHPKGNQFFSSARKLLKAVTGYKQPPSFSHYFRLDREEKISQEGKS